MVDKDHRLETESRQAKLFDKVLAKEEAWIRQGVKARRTRNEGRVRALEQLRRERGQRRELQGKPKFASNEDQKSGDLVVNAENVNFQKILDQMEKQIFVECNLNREKKIFIRNHEFRFA